MLDANALVVTIPAIEALSVQEVAALPTVTLANLKADIEKKLEDAKRLDDKLDAALDRLGFWRVANPAPEQGLSQSLRLAAQYALDRDADGILVCLGDMPYVETSHLQQIVHAFDRNGRGSVIASRAESYLGPPALFPRSAFVRLLALSGDRGAKDLLRDAIPVSASAGALADIDTRDDLVAREEPPSGPDCGA